MPKTFKDMQDDILLRANMNNHDRPFVMLEINAAIQDLFRERRWSWAEVRDTVTLTAGNYESFIGSYGAASSGVPGRIQRASVSYLTGEYVPVPEYVAYGSEDPAYPWIRSIPTATGYPTQYSWFGGSYIFNSAPLETVDYEVLRWYPPNEVTADGDFIPVPDVALDAVMWRTLSRVSLTHEREPALAQVYRAEYSDCVAKLRAIDEGSIRTSRVAMPDEYMGAYDGV